MGNMKGSMVTDASVDNALDYHQCYLHPHNTKTYALNMIMFGIQTFKAAKHVREIPAVKQLYELSLSKDVSQETVTAMSHFVFETVLDWIRIIICFENFMKAALLLQGYLIHEIDSSDPFIKMRLPNQRKRPIKLDDLRVVYDFSHCISSRAWCLEGIRPNTLMMSTLLNNKITE